MKSLFKLLLLSTVVLLTLPTTLSAYNREWSSKEDIIYPCPGPRCEKECKNPCGCEPDGTPKECECKPSPTVCCLDLPPTDKTSSPVYSKNGAFTWSETDISLIAKPSLTLKRNYTSFDAHLGLFGNAWISEFEKLFIETVKYTKDNNDIQSSDIYYILRLTNGSRYSYKYDENNNALIDTGKLQVKANKIDERHTTLTYKNGMVETYEDGYLIEKKDRSGNKLTLTYSDTKLLQSVQSGTASLTFSYNSNGFVSQVTDHTDRTWQYDYDENGNLTGVTNPLDGTKTYTYEAHKESYDAQIDYLITDISDEEGKSIVSTTYNSDGRVHSYTEGTLTYTYEYVDANTIKKTDNNGNVLTFVMDDDGFITKRIDALNNSTEEIYDEATRTATTIDANGNKWIKKQDEMGRVIASIDPLGNSTTYGYEGNNTRPKTITSPLGHVTSYTYNQNNQLISITDPTGDTKTYEYNSEGNIIKNSDALGNSTIFKYNELNQISEITNPLGQLTIITYDGLGRKHTITNSGGNTVTYEYDANDRVVKVIDPLNKSISYNYNSRNQVISIKDQIGNETKYTYDQYARVHMETRPDGGITTYTYNSNNTIKFIRRKDGKVINFTYDKTNYLLSKNIQGDTTRYIYNVSGELVKVINNSGVVTFQYDELGRIIKQNQHGIDINTEYDTESNPKKMTYLNQNIKYTRDKSGLPEKINDITIHYDKNHIKTKIIYPNQMSEEIIYDTAYNVEKINTADQNINYTRDNRGLIIKKNNISYTYDDLGRVSQAGNDSFSYDIMGNNISDAAIYNTLNNQFKESINYRITYDNMGNMSTKYNIFTKETIQYKFNLKNELIKYTELNENNQSVKILEFTYDGLGRRITKTEDSVTQKFIYNDMDIIAILDINNNLIATIIHDETIDTPLSITNKNGTFYYHRDHQGSIIALTDSNGKVIESFTYDNHYGTIVNHTKTIETNNPYTYTGRVLDTEQLYYYRARYYDSSIQSFLSEDSIGFTSKDTNWYRYVGNNPVNNIDPLGHKLSATWKQTPKSYIGVDVKTEFIWPYFNEWWDVAYLKVHATAYGFVVASALCQDIDECGVSKEWVVPFKSEMHSYTYSADTGPFANGPTIAATIFSGPLGVGVGSTMAGSKMALIMYKVRIGWLKWGQKIINSLINNGPMALCAGGKQ